MKRQKSKKGIIVFIIALATMIIAPIRSFADSAKKVTIVHKGKQITVSCNALEGHKKHADQQEERSIQRAERVCSS